jgi:hypothetical protein
MRITCTECVFVALGIQHAYAHAPYCSLWPDRLYLTFQRYPINCSVFDKMLLILKYVLRYSLQSLPETFLILRRTE